MTLLQSIGRLFGALTDVIWLAIGMIPGWGWWFIIIMLALTSMGSGVDPQGRY